MEQGSTDWHEWRSKGIGASDAAAILGVSPWKTRYQLWLEKTGQALEKDSSNPATRRGKDLEPVARANYEFMHNRTMPPILIVHKEHEFLRASLDGFDGEMVLEIKCPGAEDHALARGGKIPDKYYPQLQHQLMVTGAQLAHYWSFDGASGELVVVMRDDAYIEKLLQEEMIFWECVLTRQAPGLSDKDFKTVEDESFRTAIDEWKSIKLKIEALEEEEKIVRETIIAMAKADHPKLEYNNVQITRSRRQGSIEYSKVPAIKDMDLEPFRKPPIEIFTFKVVK